MSVDVETTGRRRSMAALLGGVAATNTSMVGASTASTLIGAEELTELWSGVPNAAGVLGTAAGTLWLAALMARRGTRSALSLGYLVAIVGAAVAGAAVASGQVLLLIFGMVLLGVGNGGAQLSRYCAADLYPPRRQGLAVGVIVWAGTVGAVFGPNLMEPSATAASRLGLPDLAGPFLVALLAAGICVLASAAMPRSRTAARRGANDPTPAQVWRHPVVSVALVSMIAGQLAMVALMTMTPLHMSSNHHGLTAVGVVLSGHMIGMFALAPLSGYLSDRFGGRAAILMGIGLLVTSVVVASWPAAHGSGLTRLVVSLFLLGWGWNLTFVGGSALLTQALTPAARRAVQGRVDALVWAASAVASVVAGVVLATTNYVVLSVAAGVVSLIPVPMLRRRPPAEESATAPEHADAVR
ncbi:MFS transporter [Micromonospora sp. DT46]|uniref:MFS transporter n=1 Tax=unclassified Micromonospora TaxID=2617518 RepID=UPI002E154FF7|nr:MFS transporter [Micromonospora sp. NBC_01740]